MYKDLYNTALKYHLNCSNTLNMNGEPDNYTDLMHTFNTFLDYFWRDYFGGGFWAQDSFLMDDIRETQRLFIEQTNKGDDEITIGMLNFISNIKKSPQLSRYGYKNAATYFGPGYEEHGVHPRSILDILMPIFKHGSIQEMVRKEIRESGFPYISFSIQ